MRVFRMRPSSDEPAAEEPSYILSAPKPELKIERGSTHVFAFRFSEA